MVDLTCACGRELEEKGAVLLRRPPGGPTLDGIMPVDVVEKYHLCNACETAVITLLRRRARFEQGGGREEQAQPFVPCPPVYAVGFDLAKLDAVPVIAERRDVDGVGQTRIVNAATLRGASRGGDPALEVTDDEFIDGLRSLDRDEGQGPEGV